MFESVYLGFSEVESEMMSEFHSLWKSKSSEEKLHITQSRNFPPFLSESQPLTGSFWLTAVLFWEMITTNLLQDKRDGWYKYTIGPRCFVSHMSLNPKGMSTECVR